MTKRTIWLRDHDDDEVLRIMDEERRGSVSNTISALVGEAIEARKARAKAAEQQGANGRGGAALPSV